MRISSLPAAYAPGMLSKRDAMVVATAATPAFFRNVRRVCTVPGALSSFVIAMVGHSVLGHVWRRGSGASSLVLEPLPLAGHSILEPRSGAPSLRPEA